MVMKSGPHDAAPLTRPVLADLGLDRDLRRRHRACRPVTTGVGAVGAIRRATPKRAVDDVNGLAACGLVETRGSDRAAQVVALGKRHNIGSNLGASD
jgi:hypothetical protein